MRLHMKWRILMFHRILCFFIMLLIAAVTGIMLPNIYSQIECNNTGRICKKYSVNSVFKTKTLVNSVNIDSARGTIQHVMGVGQNNKIYLTCYKQSNKVYLRDGKTKIRVRYLLAPVGKPHPMEFDAINEYVSQTSCEVDKLNIENYIKSGSDKTFVYTVGSNHLRYLWYPVSVLLIVLAFLALFKGRVLTKEEEAELRESLKKSLPEETILQTNESVKKIMGNISDFDELGSGIIKQTEKKINKYRIDIEKKDY